MVFSPRPNQNSTKTSTGRKLFSFAIMGCLIFGVMSYLYLTNDLATKGYEIKELEKTLEEVEVSSQRLETEVATKQLSKSTTENGQLPEGYVAVEKIEYLAASPQGGVAVK